MKRIWNDQDLVEAVNISISDIIKIFKTKAIGGTFKSKNFILKSKH